MPVPAVTRDYAMARLNAHPLKSLLLVCAHQTLLGQGGQDSGSDTSAGAALAETRRFRFAVGTVRYALFLEPTDGPSREFRRRMMAQFGRMPYTAESPASRAALKALLRLCQETPGFRLVPGQGQVLWALHDDRMAGDPSAARLLHDLFRFVHATLPFARMLCPYLR